MHGNLIGEYLKARRALVRPEDVGITATSHRRVPGLRRDELAMLAGISTEYYTRLEQGRDRRPSARVLDALAAALRLDREAAVHLHELANPTARDRDVSRHIEEVRPSIARLIGSWTHTPAFIQGRYLDVLAANRMATALNPVYRRGVNLVRAALLDPAARALGADVHIRYLIGTLRAAAGADLDHPRLKELVAELSAESDLFRRHWPRHDVQPRPTGGTHRLEHPRVGPLELRYDKFFVAGAEEQMMVVYQADPGSPSAAALARLAETA